MMRDLLQPIGRAMLVRNMLDAFFKEILSFNVHLGNLLKTAEAEKNRKGGH